MSALGEGAVREENGPVTGGFYFPQSNQDYVGVFPVSRLSGYHLYRADEPAESAGEISGSPFVFHTGPSYCGWIGLPGFGWFGCGLQPGLIPFPTRASRDEGTASIQLAVGMGRREVLQSVGAPSRKILLGLREIWEYKGYSLLFDSGGLMEIR